MSARGRTVLVTGATGAAGRRIVPALAGAGARVVAMTRGDDAVPDAARTEHGDPASSVVVDALARRLHTDGVHLDGVVHLIGGWRGGGGIAGQRDEDYRMLAASFDALRHVSRAFDADPRASDAGRFVFVSSTAVARPLAGGANAAAVKASGEAWTRAVAHGFAKAARDAGEPLRAAAVIVRVRSLEPVAGRLADAVVDLWTQPAGDLNDTVRTLEP